MQLTALLSLLPLLALTDASPTPLKKRYTNARIRSGRSGLCLSQAPNQKLMQGSEIFTVDCDTALQWNINPGSGSVLVGEGVTNPPLALDAGSNPGNNGKLKVWQSYPGLYQQTWYLTDDNRIAITGGDQCLDEGDDGPQTYKCTTGNTNQVWYIDAGDSPAPSQSALPQPTPSAEPSDDYPIPDVQMSSARYADPASGGRRIRINGRDDLCLTTAGGYNARGALVAISGCFSNGATFIDEQLWDLPESGSGQIKVHSNPELCLDAGENVANGNPITLYDCLDVPQQMWTWGENGLLSVNNNQCLDVRKESGRNYAKPYVWEKTLQTWECSAQDPYQQFALYGGPDVNA